MIQCRDLHRSRGFGALEHSVSDAIHCHFDEDERPSIVRLHITREKVITV